MATNQSTSPSHNPEMLFSEAAASWLDLRDSPSIRMRYLKPRTIKTYRLEIKALILFFGKMRLCRPPEKRGWTRPSWRKFS